MSYTFHTFKAGGYLGVEPRKETTTPSQQRITINEADWDAHDLLMPASIRDLMWQQQAQVGKEKLLERKYAPDTILEPDLEILLPVGVREVIQ